MAPHPSALALPATSCLLPALCLVGLCIYDLCFTFPFFLEVLWWNITGFGNLLNSFYFIYLFIYFLHSKDTLIKMASTSKHMGKERLFWKQIRSTERNFLFLISLFLEITKQTEMFLENTRNEANKNILRELKMWG